ncbi:MAG: DUF115 domain-containing protein [Nitrososphaeraceae archaeon]|nr:DUF115 domain-containing protein [Nitrososphaeraceae archaeon]
METTEWAAWYEKIALVFGFDRNEDQRATSLLSELIRNKAVKPNEIRNLLKNQYVLIFGAGPSLKKDLQKIKESNLLEKFISITVDGATTAFFELMKKPPQIVITDLDGQINDQILASKLGSILVIHGHGDNIKQLLTFVPKFRRVLGTTQVKETQNVYNFGGFTDGDRAVFLAITMSVRSIILAGMDLGDDIGEYSKIIVKSKERKIQKLKFCKELLEWLATRTQADLYNLTETGENIKGFKKISPYDLPNLVK